MADGLVTVAELREEFDIDGTIPDKRFERALVAAGRRMRQWVGDAAYDDALLVAPVDAQRKEDLKYAEEHLAMGYAILGLNTALRREGIVRTEKLEGNTVVTYHSPSEIEKLQEQFFETAETLARQYLLNDGVIDEFVAVTSDESAEAATGNTICC